MVDRGYEYNPSASQEAEGFWKMCLLKQCYQHVFESFIWKFIWKCQRWLHKAMYLMIQNPRYILAEFVDTRQTWVSGVHWKDMNLMSQPSHHPSD